LDSVLNKKNTTSAKIFDWYVTTLRKRASAPAFHPDASQEVLDLGDEIFGLVRSSTDGNQSIVCLYNFSTQPISPKPIDRIKHWFPTGRAKDLISGGEIVWGDQDLILRPYQALWLVSH